MLASPIFKKLSSFGLLNSLSSLLCSLSSGYPFLFPSLTPLPLIHTWMYMFLRIRPQSFLFSCFTQSPWTNFSDFMILAVTSLVIPLRSLSQQHNYLWKHFDIILKSWILTYMLYDTAIPPVGISPRVTVIYMHQKTCKKIFIAHCSE